MTDTGEGHDRHIRTDRLHTGHCARQQNVAHSASDQQNRNMCQGAKQCPQVGSWAVQKPRDPRIPQRVPASVGARRVCQLRHAAPACIGVERKRRQVALQEPDAGIKTFERRVATDEIADELGTLGADVRADVVQHHRSNQTRTHRGQTHAEQAAKTGADQDGPMNMESGTGIHDIADACLRRIAVHICRATGITSTGVVDGDDPAAGTNHGSQDLKIRSGANHPGKADDRRQAIATKPLPHVDHKPIPGADPVG